MVIIRSVLPPFTTNRPVRNTPGTPRTPGLPGAPGAPAAPVITHTSCNSCTTTIHLTRFFPFKQIEWPFKQSDLLKGHSLSENYESSLPTGHSTFFFSFLRKSYQQMEPTGPRSCWLRHCKFFQEQPPANQEIKDRLLYGSFGPLSLMATSDCSNQVRPHLESHLVSHLCWILGSYGTALLWSTTMLFSNYLQHGY